MLSRLYRSFTLLAAPVIGAYMRRRLAAGKEDPERFAERFGNPSLQRPDGRLIWCHAASVGEVASLLLLIDKLQANYPDAAVLITTGTVTAAQLVSARNISGAVHQYSPIDRPDCVKRFLDHWRPSFAIWTESELWPNTLLALRNRDIPAVLLNARMSEKSFRNWMRAKGFARELMSCFRLCLAQTENDRGRFVALGASPVKVAGNLKYASSPLPFDNKELAGLRKDVEGRDVWLMSSTHRGEEEMAIAAHKSIASKRKTLLTVIVPRHAVRGDEIAGLLDLAGLKYSRRSKGEEISSSTQIYLADTMGELGLFYSLCPISVLGGSFVRVGGHNPIEAAQLGSAIAFGPYMYNFSEITHEFLFAQAAVQLKHDNEISFTVERLFDDVQERKRLAQAGAVFAESKRHVIDKIISEIDGLFRRAS